MLKSKITPLLMKWKIFDPDETLSLSNVALMVLVVKMAIAPQLDFPTLTAFFAVLLNHNAKKNWNRLKVSKQIADTDRLAKLEQEQKAINQAIAMRNLQR